MGILIGPFVYDMLLIFREACAESMTFDSHASVACVCGSVVLLHTPVLKLNSALIRKGRVRLTQHYSGHKIEKNKMGRSCSACGGEERCVQGFGGET